jgi:capsular exopolysaccharide synthesis family protein
VSRIEEALRRSGAAGARPVPQPTPAHHGDTRPEPAGDPVEDPWGFREHPAASVPTELHLPALDIEPLAAEVAPPPAARRAPAHPCPAVSVPDPASPPATVATPGAAAPGPTRVQEHTAPHAVNHPLVERTPAPIQAHVPTPVEAPMHAPGGAPAVPVPATLAGRLDPRQSEKLVVGNRIPPLPLEQYRKLAASLHHAQADHGLRVVMVTSALATEGKTLTATNLALTLAESYRRRVLLVDADLRRPSLHEVFQVPNVAGLSDGLKGNDDRKLSLIQISPTLTLLPAGRPEPDPMAALSSARMRRVIAEAAESFDWVILDTPPVGLLTDAHLLAAMVDGTLLVVRAEHTPYDAVRRATDILGRERVLGVVLNAVEPDVALRKQGYGYSYNYNYYGQDRETGAR